jgi:hypothetical protein
LDQDDTEVYCVLQDHCDGKVVEPKTPREVDVSLMVFVVHPRGNFKRTQIIAIDHCRVFFQVMPIADITSNNGQFIFNRTTLAHWILPDYGYDGQDT